MVDSLTRTCQIGTKWPVTADPVTLCVSQGNQNPRALRELMNGAHCCCASLPSRFPRAVVNGGNLAGRGNAHRAVVILFTTRRGVAQPGRALGSGPRGRWFESTRPDQFKLEGRDLLGDLTFLLLGERFAVRFAQGLCQADHDKGGAQAAPFVVPGLALSAPRWSSSRPAPARSSRRRGRWPSPAGPSTRRRCARAGCPRRSRCRPACRRRSLRPRG